MSIEQKIKLMAEVLSYIVERLDQPLSPRESLERMEKRVQMLKILRQIGSTR